MSQDLLKAFQQAYRNLELLPLIEQKDLSQFRVDYGSEVIEELEQLVEDSPNGDGKIIFTGHRGCGKSTLLAEFSRRLADRYFVVLFSISETIEMSDVNHVNILFAIAVNLMYEAEARQVEIPKSTKDAFYKWFATRIKTETETLEAEVSGGFDLLKLFKSALKVNASVRNEIKQEFERKISDLVARINEMAAIIQATLKKEVLVIIDDLDKLELERVNYIYRDNIKALCQPNFRIIYTIPIAVLRDKFLRPLIETETNDQVVVMPVLKLFEKGQSRQPHPQPRSQAKDVLCEILQKRIADELIEPKAAEQIVLNSGGVLRELIRIANECCRICLRLIRRKPGEAMIINEQILDEAVNNIRNDFAVPLGKLDYAILQTTYQNFTPDDPKEPEFLDLLHGLYVLEYRNRKNWYDVHPIVVELLKEQGLINAN
ncbi:ATP-binding protein [Sphaerospermopsis torques-reginae]|uniref:ATP-binding protein n=1 Tax=Sphaerospermopsis torques-reginae ITEP-024 TaxID=984208 RepID=A0ABX8X113_9CYAN|nr:ATP-binding protein [Sphaerospermopsis torques-reginae]QYX32394.1 ATP-binding protein [Sphaerospermopsis torques-reginae ITEP-024]